MKTQATFLLAAALLVSSGCVSSVKTASNGDPVMDAQSRRRLAENTVAGWSDTSRGAAQVLLSRYGAPDVVGSSRLVWHANGVWKRTTVRDLPRPYSGAADEDLGVVEQTVPYRVTPEQSKQLFDLGDRLNADSSAMELSSRSDREEVNFLRLNLANDVLRRALTPDEARDVFTRTLELEAAGKTSRYMQGLTFGRP